MKLPPPEDQPVDPKAAAGAKGAPAKGAPKGGVVVELKPSFGRAWINLESLMQPGAVEVKQRVFVETCPPLVKKMGEDGVERLVQTEDAYETIYETAKTYIYLKISLSEPVTPTIA